METRSKDIMRYVILGLVSIFTWYVIMDVIWFTFAAEVEKMSTQVAALLGTIVTAVTGGWTAVLNWFFKTKAE